MARALTLALGVAAVAAKQPGLRTPMMGWTTWCTDGPCERDVCNEVRPLWR